VCLHDGVGDETSRNLTPTKPTTIQTLDSFLSAFNAIKFDVNLALGFFLHFDGLDRSIFCRTFTLDIFSKVFVPISLSFPVCSEQWLVCRCHTWRNSLFRIKHVLQQDRLGCHRCRNIDSGSRLWKGRRSFSPSKFLH
jgi:hypothetical protein